MGEHVAGEGEWAVGKWLSGPGVSFPSAGIAVIFGPPVHVEVDQSLSYTAAAKLFLNEVCRICSQPAPFTL
jgi:hypothetical protein